MRRRPEMSEALTAATDRASSEVSQTTTKGTIVSDSTEVQVSSQPVFSFGEHKVRVVVRDGEPWFVASDVCAALDYKNTSKAVADHLDADERMTLTAGYGHSAEGVSSTYTPSRRGGARYTVVINESGLYALVLRSRKPEARKFAKWVTSEVLPAIRKTGVYVGKPFTVNPGDVLTQDEQNTLRLMLKSAVERLPKEKQAGAMVKGWSKLKAHFGVPYRQIPRAEFSEAVSIVARHTAEWEVVDEEPGPEKLTIDPERLELSFALAMEAVQEVAKTVFCAVAQGKAEDFQHSRYLLALTYDANTQRLTRPWAKRLDQDVVTLSLPEMAARLRGEGRGEFYPRETELAELGAAIAWKQARYAERRAADRKAAQEASA